MRPGDVSAYWVAAGVLVPCPFCGAAAFESCKPVDILLPNGNRLTRSVNYQGSAHAQRTYQGHAVLERMLVAGGQSAAAANDHPPQAPIGYEEVLELIEVAVARALAAAQKPPARKRAPRRTT